MRFSFFSVLFAIGCSSTPATPDGGVDAATDGPAPDATTPYAGPDYVSGTRLRAEVFTSADGAKKWHGWFDSQLGIECSFGYAEDLALRCLPPDAAFFGNAYSDVACTLPIASVSQCATAPKYVVEQDPDACKQQVYALGAKAALSDYYQNPSCVQTPTNGTGYDFYPIGAKVDPTTFVKGTIENDPRGPDLQAQFIVGEDGSRVVKSPYDIQRKGRCSAQEVAFTPNADRCVPAVAAFAAQYFSDTSCSILVATNGSAACAQSGADEAATASHVYPPGTCQIFGPTKFAELTGAESTAPLYSMGSTCNEILTPPPWRALGANIDATSLPAINYAQVGTGRVVESWQVAASQDRLQVDTLYDTTQKTKCAATSASDGMLRCVPSATTAGQLYTDAQCSTPIFTQGGTLAPCSLPPLPTQVYFQLSAACGGKVAIATIGAKVAVPAALWQTQGATCASTVVDGTVDYYSATFVDPTTFAPLTDVTE